MNWRFELWKLAFDWRLWVLAALIWGPVLVLRDCSVAHGQLPVEVTPL